MIKSYFLIGNKLVPLIFGGSVESVGSTLSVSFASTISANPNTSKSSDILFTQLAIGEGPIYRINPNGPQDIEIDDRYIDDLVDFTTNNTKPEVFATSYVTGTVSQKAMPSFGQELVTNVRFNSPIVLKSGLSSNPDVVAPAATSLLFYPTSPSSDVNAIDSIKIKFNVTDLKTSGVSGDESSVLTVAAVVHSYDELSDINNYVVGGGMIITSLIVGGMAAELELKIPEDKKSASGYRVSVLKISEDIAEEGYTAEIEVTGFDEIRKSPYSYPRTAIAGFAIKSTDFRTDSNPTFSSLVKGMIVDVPSNYNQPILETGEVDWRQLEVPASGENSSTSRGYRLQNSGSTLIYDANPTIYLGTWDGSYKSDWTENVVWVIKHILTDIFNIPESAIDKYNFYSAAQYCDAVDPYTGNFIGIQGFSDGSFRFKPTGYLSGILETLLGLPDGTPIRERRFVCGVSITDSTDLYNLLSALAASIRAVISVSSGKIRLIIDKPDTLPVAMFNETNIEERSFKLSGIRDEDIITGVDISFTNFINHFKKETLTLNIEDVGLIDFEKKISVDIAGCTRKSQALRMAKYLLDSNSLLKRKLQFTAFADASDLEIGDIISVSQQISNTSYGYGGIIHNNSVEGTSNVYLEYYTSPAISQSVFTSNTKPLALKIFKQETNLLEYYLISNTSYSFTSSGFSSSGNDLLEVEIIAKMNPFNKQFVSYTSFTSNSVPAQGDIWALGEIDIDNIYTQTADKLFKVDQLTILNSGKVSITATEYDADILAAVDNAAVSATSTSVYNLNYVTPPVPVLSIKSIPTKNDSGIITYGAALSASIDTANYNIPVSTFITYGIIPNLIDVISQG
jgi:hypothetical protein